MSGTVADERPQGTCYCGRKTKKGYKTCPRCLEKAKKSVYERYAKLRREGRCTACARLIVGRRTSRSRCARCTLRAAAAFNAKRSAWRRIGYCARCGKRRAELGWRLCRPCQDYGRSAQRRSRGWNGRENSRHPRKPMIGPGRLGFSAEEGVRGASAARKNGENGGKRG